MSLRKVWFVCAAATLGGCFEAALETDEAYVIGGTLTADGEFPGVGALMYDFGGQVMQGCTGTLIAPNAVLTAAHCVDPELTGPVTPGFSLDLDTTNGNAITVPGLVAHKHESFSIDVEPLEGLAEFFDIGVLILSQPITTVAPVKMPRPEHGTALIAGLDLAIVGYGRTSNATQDTGVMYDAMTKLISFNTTEIQVGMGSPQPQNCQGDSGGPALADVGGARRVVGVVSRSYSGFECTMGGVDTRVDAYLEWIHGKVPTGIPCGSGLAEACPEEEDPEDEGGCCSTGGGGGAGAGVLGLLVGMALLRPRRRR
ncbi:MAG: trypsin-like serine protease [Kofleriaceae bacterium]|nr:MAG: trypsin-like serine protease [Kofleriaceae bacterium]MBZ0235233.1 trypsin-like serine protease [Kofleriaceae bacterium]